MHGIPWEFFGALFQGMIGNFSLNHNKANDVLIIALF